jgi:uncharacterized protein (AIM24 family)
MSFRTNIYDTSEERSIKQRKGPFAVLEYAKDLSVAPEDAQLAWFSSEMNVRKRQLIAEIKDKNGVFAQAGEMQMMIGDIEAVTGVKGAGDLFKKLVSSVVSSESVIKPHYVGDGVLVLEPTYKHILLEDMKDWPDGMVIEDGMFLACEDGTDISITGRKTVSSMILGGEGLFNLTLMGDGLVALESPVPREELIEIELEEDTVRIDGNMAIAWSPELRFTVDKSMGTLIGSAVSGEGFVNVYEGTGKILMAPVRNNKRIKSPETKQK